MALTLHRTPAPSRRTTFVPALGLLAVVTGALLITGTLLTLGLVLIPVLLFGVLVYALRQHRRARVPGPTDAVVPDDASSSASEKSV
jgi:hypothetical protein